MALEIGKGDLVALDLAAVSLRNLAGEGHRLSNLNVDGVGSISEIRELDDVLAVLVSYLVNFVGNLRGSLHRAGAGVPVLLEGGFQVVEIAGGAASHETVFSAGALLEERVFPIFRHHELDGVCVIRFNDDVHRQCDGGGVVLSGGGVSRGTDQCERRGQGERRKSRQDGQGPRDAVGDGRCHAHTVAVQMPGCNRIVMGIVPRRVCYWNCCGGGQVPCCWGGQVPCCWGGQVPCCWGACVGEGG